MATPIFIRNTRAGDQLEIFFLSAITSLLTVRLYLHLTNYPQVGGDHFHIAHMLYGGFFMLIANVLLISFVGKRIERAAAVIGGIGFGVFIDELGKFITKDNDYFFHPTVALLYLIFVGMSLVFRALGRERGYSKQEYLVNGLLQLDEAALQDMDEVERAHTLALLHRADQVNPLTKALIKVVGSIKSEPVGSRSPLRRVLYRLRAWYDRTITTSVARSLIATFFIADSIYLIARLVIDPDFDELLQQHAYVQTAQFISSVVSTILVLIGIYYLARSRYQAYEYFRRALIVTLFVTQFFAFYREEFGALLGFFINLAAFIAIRYVLAEERRLSRMTKREGLFS